MRQEMMGFGDGSDIGWTVCKRSAPRSRQTTTPTPHHSFFTSRMLFLTPNQLSKHERHSLYNTVERNYYGAVSMTGSARNRIWHLLTSAPHMMTWLLPALWSYSLVSNCSTTACIVTTEYVIYLLLNISTSQLFFRHVFYFIRCR